MEQSCNSATGRQELWIGGTLKRPGPSWWTNFSGQPDATLLREKNRSSNNQGAFCYLRPDPDPVLNNVLNLLKRSINTFLHKSLVRLSNLCIFAGEHHPTIYADYTNPADFSMMHNQ